LSIPAGDNLADNAQVAIDTLDPETVISRVTYNNSTGNIVLAGSDFIDLGHDLGTILTTQEELSQFDWESLTWKSGSQDRVFNVSDIQSVTIAANNMTVNLKSETVSILSYDGELNAQSLVLQRLMVLQINCKLIQGSWQIWQAINLRKLSKY